MNTWFRKVGMGALALTLAGVLGGCNNGSGGGLIRLFFGINGSGDCTTVVIDVTLNDSDVIARDESGEILCAINAALDAACRITFEEFEDGDLRVIISDDPQVAGQCIIDAVSNLFYCDFEDVDISELQDSASAQCTCTTQNCDGTPPVCISTDPDPRSCEICDNDIDDDGNGFIDCQDPNCENSSACSTTTTTTTTSTTGEPVTTSTTNTTSTSVTVTTTTLIICDNLYRVVFATDEDVTFGALQWDTTPPGDASGGFVGSSGNVDCASLVEVDLAAFNDCETSPPCVIRTQQNPSGGVLGSLTSGLIDFTGFNGPTDLAECTFAACGNFVPEIGDFLISGIEASDPDLLPIILPADGVVVKSVELVGGPTTTTTTTTTGEPGTTTTTEPGPTTTTMPGGTPQDYTVIYKLDAATASLVGALQIKSDYSSATGGFQGNAGAVACTSTISGLFAPNDDEAAKTLTLGIISFTGYSAPINLATCIFNGFTNDPPTSADFPFIIEDQTDVDGNPITATVSVTVTP